MIEINLKPKTFSVDCEVSKFKCDIIIEEPDIVCHVPDDIMKEVNEQLIEELKKQINNEKE